MLLATASNGYNVGIKDMTTLKQHESARDIQRETRSLKATARKLAASKAAARRFLLSTGIYSASGQLKPEFR